MAYPIGTSSSRSPLFYKIPIILIFGVPKWFQNLQTCIIMDPFAAGNLLRCCCSEGVCRDGYRMGHPLCQWALRKKRTIFRYVLHQTSSNHPFSGIKMDQTFWAITVDKSFLSYPPRLESASLVFSPDAPYPLRWTCCDVGTPYRISISEYDMVFPSGMNV